MLRLGTLFSGIGAIEQALIRLGIDYQLKFACDNGDVDIDIDVEKEKDYVFNLKSKKEKKEYVDDLYFSKSRKQNYVKESYLANYNLHEDDFHNDVRLLDGRDYKDEVDLLVGGSPCQSFSSVGFKGGLDDVRGTLFYEYARLIKEIQPKVFIYENVRGMTTHDGGKTWKKMQEVFTNTLHYRITKPQVLNAADYGIPQNRRRLFVIGIREDLDTRDFEYPEPIGIENLKYTMQDFLEDNCKYDEENNNFTYSEKDGSLIVKKVKGEPDPKFTLTSKVRDYVIKSGTKGFKTSVETDLPVARTLLRTMTQHHRAGVDNYITIGYDEDGKKILRSLTDRECLRLMGFPDSFKIVVSSQQMLKQAGNSIVVDVMMALVNQIYETGVFGGLEKEANMGRFIREDAFEVNFVDSAARKEFKLKEIRLTRGTEQKGTGESRIYVGTEEEKYDEFFDFENVKYFFTTKEALQKYLVDAEEEYVNPSQEYSVDVGEYLEENINKTNAIRDEIIKFEFRKTFDRQKRYYLVLKKRADKNYQHIRDICLPRVTKFCFIKFRDEETNEKIIYLQPIFFNAIEDKVEIINKPIISNREADVQKRNYRLRQTEYRLAVIRAMPFCPFTHIADDRLLQACHIKPYRKCENDDERYDPKNGIAMTPTYHVLFDLGFISFENNGKLLISPFLSNITKRNLNITEGQIIRIQSGSDKYLEYHRNNIFCKMPDLDIEE